MIMELQELKDLWGEYDRKLDKNLQLNLQLLRKINFDKVAGKARTLLIYKMLEMIAYLFLLVILGKFEIKYFTEPALTIPAVLSTALILAGFISDARMVAIIIQLQSGYDAAISPMQKNVEKLKLLIVHYVKWSLLAIPCYPVFMIVAAKIFMNMDLWSPKHQHYLFANLLIGVLLLPLFIWLFIQIGKPETKYKWIKNVLAGSGWNQAQSAQEFLNEIERFEES